MMRWAVIVVSGICVFFSWYMAYLAFGVDDGGAYLFAGFGLLFGIPFVVTVVNVFHKQKAPLERMDEKLSGRANSVKFVPHWFMIAAMIVVGVCIFAAILISILGKPS